MAPLDEAPSSCSKPVVGLVGAGHMGSALGAALRTGGARVVTTLDGRSPRTVRMVAAAGIEVLPDLDEVVRAATHVLVVTPPSQALAAAKAIAEATSRTMTNPLIADLNAIAPATVEAVVATLGTLDFVDGSISGPPPTVRPGARLYFSGPRAADMIALPWHSVTAIYVGSEVGAASAVKMSTASVYKGTVGLYAQAIRSADYYGVLDAVLDDLRDSAPDLGRAVALAATKAERYAPEMREIAIAQQAAGLPADLFTAFADIYAAMADTPLAAEDPETLPLDLSAHDVVTRLNRS